MAPSLFFHFNIFIFINFLKYKTVETHALAFFINFTYSWVVKGVEKGLKEG